MGKALNDMVNDCMKQFPSFVDGTAKPEFNNRVVIPTTVPLTMISSVLHMSHFLRACVREVGKQLFVV